MGRKSNDNLQTLDELESVLAAHRAKVKADRAQMEEQREAAKTVQQQASDAMNLAVIAGDADTYSAAKADFERASSTVEMIDKRVNYYGNRRFISEDELTDYVNRAAEELNEKRLAPAVAEFEAAQAKAKEAAESLTADTARVYGVLTAIMNEMCSGPSESVATNARGQASHTPRRVKQKIDTVSAAGTSFAAWVTNSTAHSRNTAFEKAFGFTED